jgi:hypothetical protein
LTVENLPVENLIQFLVCYLEGYAMGSQGFFAKEFGQSIVFRSKACTDIKISFILKNGYTQFVESLTRKIPIG